MTHKITLEINNDDASFLLGTIDGLLAFESMSKKNKNTLIRIRNSFPNTAKHEEMLVEENESG